MKNLSSIILFILLAKLNGKWMIRTVLWQGPLKTDSK